MSSDAAEPGHSADANAADRSDGDRGSGKGRAVAVAVGVTLAALAVSLVGGVALVVPVLVFELSIESAPVFLALTVAGQLGFLVVGYAYARRYDRRIPVDLPTGREVGIGVGGALLAVVVAAALSAVVSSLGLLPESVIGEAAGDDPRILLGLAALSLVVIAPIEEFVFRGVVQGRLRDAFGPAGAIVGASLLFGSLHLANYAGDVPSVVAGALVIVGTGAVLGALYEYTDNLTVPIVAHGLYNALLLGVAYATA